MSRLPETSSYPQPPSCRPSPAAIALAALLAGATLSVLPLFGLLSARRHPTVQLCPAPDVVVPLPPAPRRPQSVTTLQQAAPDPRRPKLRKPELKKPKRNVQPLRAQLSLPLSSLRTNPGDFALDFAIRADVPLPRKTGTADRKALAVPKQEPLLFQLYELDAPPQPLSVIEPIYPAAAKAKGIEGFVELEFIITPEGKVTDVKVARSHPDGYFESSAKRAAARWRFAAPTRHGRPVRVRVRQMVQFRMER